MTIREWVGPVDAGRFRFGADVPGVFRGGVATGPDGQWGLIPPPLPPGWTPGRVELTPEEWDRQHLEWLKSDAYWKNRVNDR